MKCSAKRRGRVRRDVLHRGRVGGVGRHDHSVIHRAFFAQRLDHVRHLAGPLPDGAVDANDVSVALVDDRIDRDRGLPRRAVPNDEFPLSPADRYHRVDRLESRLERLRQRAAAARSRAQRYRSRARFRSGRSARPHPPDPRELRQPGRDSPLRPRPRAPALVHRTSFPSWRFVHSPRITAPMLSSSRLSASAVTGSPPSEGVISSISLAIAFVRP